MVAKNMQRSVSGDRPALWQPKSPTVTCIPLNQDGLNQDGDKQFEDWGVQWGEALRELVNSFAKYRRLQGSGQKRKKEIGKKAGSSVEDLTFNWWLAAALSVQAVVKKLSEIGRTQ